MPLVNTRTRYIVYTHGGSGVRHHHFSTQNNIIDEADGHASTGDTIPAQGFPIQFFNGSPVPFAFMSVHGAADGNQLYTEPGNQSVSVGTTDVDILVVYAPPGGIGVGGGPGIWVDAFNVDAGDFSDSLDFIQVLTPPTPPDTVDAAKTTFGNLDGGVSTTTAENVRANAHVDGVPFLEWKKIVPLPSVQSAREIDLAQNQSGEIWFAFYQTPPSSGTGANIPHIVATIGGGLFLWTGDDTCGNGGHWVFPHGPGPVGPFKLSFSKDVVARLSADQRKRLEGFAKEYPAIAQAGLSSMTKVLEVLQGVSALVGAGKQQL